MLIKPGHNIDGAPTDRSATEADWLWEEVVIDSAVNAVAGQAGDFLDLWAAPDFVWGSWCVLSHSDSFLC